MLCGYGKDYLWADAFADLQKNLPNNVKMRCCMTCRHGNMCPVGNKPGELFCTKDVSITQKSDLFFYTENETYESTAKLYKIEENLKNLQFARISKTVIANLDKMLSIKKSENSRLVATLVNKEKLVVSRQYVSEIKKKLGV